MAEDSEKKPDDVLAQPKRDLKDALVRARDRMAERDDVVVDLKTSEAGRLELLADELRPVFADLDDTDERFELAISKGERPRLWIDMTSFVVMGADKRQYRFLKDTRMGRIVLAETNDMAKTADIVSDYIAEKVLERERMIEGEWVSLRHAPDEKPETEAETAPVKKSGSGWRSFFWFIIGMAMALAAVLALAFVLVPDAF